MLTSAAPDAFSLTDGLLFCEVQSWWTGRRLVSLPFSDYCDPIGCGEGLDESRALWEYAQRLTMRGNFRYLELRLRDEHPVVAEGAWGDSVVSSRFYWHTIDLSPGREALYRNLHKDSVVRKIGRAKREGLTISREATPREVGEFHHLFLLTRRRHGYPPPPLRWLENLFEALGAAASLHLARKPSGEAIAGIVLLRHGSTMYYKYGASNERHHAMGGMPLLFWDAIRGAEESGFSQLDLGRTDIDGTGLIEFKEKLGAARRNIQYRRIPGGTEVVAKAEDRQNPWLSKRVRRWWCGHLPDSVLAWAGAKIYPHIG